MCCQVAAAIGIWSGLSRIHATELRIRLEGPASIVRRSVNYQCEGGAESGLPEKVFTVEYLNDGANSLAVLPIHSRSLIFANVLSGSGARYVAGPYTWWEAAGRSISLSVSSLNGTKQYNCQRAKNTGGD